MSFEEYDFVKHFCYGDTNFRVMEVKGDRIKASRHPGYGLTVTDSADSFSSWEDGEEDEEPSNSQPTSNLYGNPERRRY